jgi:transcriptional regulator with XRE-family HTH domain
MQDSGYARSRAHASRTGVGRPPTSGDMGRAVRVLRRQRGLSIEALAFAAGMHPTYLSSIEREGRNPSLTKLWALVDALGVPFGEMARLAEDQARERRAVERALAEARAREQRRKGSRERVIGAAVERSSSQ